MSNKLVILNTNLETRNFHITRAIWEDAVKLLGNDKVRLATYDNLVETCKGSGRPLLLCIDGQRLNPDIIHSARAYSHRCVLWTFDDPYNLKSHKKYKSLFDHIYTNDKSSVDLYDGSATFLPLAAPTRLLDLPNSSRNDYDVFFCGTAWPNRVVMLNKLMRDRPNLRFRFALSYNPATPRIPLNLPTTSYLQALSFSDFIEYTRRSSITLSLHRNFSGTDTFASSSSPGPRLFEVAAAGGYQLSEVGGDDFTSILPPDLITYFESYDDVLAKIDEAVAQPERRQESALKLRNFVADRHTYVHRIKSILEQSQGPHLGAPVSRARADRPKLLFVVHNTIKGGPGGGLEIHQDILAQNLKPDFDITFFTTEPVGADKRSALLADANYNVLSRSSVEMNIGHANLQNPSLEAFFGRCLKEYGFDLVHFFHFMNNAPSLAHVARSLGIPYTTSFHDFYASCRRFNLLNADNHYCENDRTKVADCDICLKRGNNFPRGSQIMRREYFGEVLARSESLMYVSDSTRLIHEGIYPPISGSDRARIHGAPIPNNLWPVSRAKRSNVPGDPGTLLRFVVLGNFLQHKGADYLLDALAGCPPLNAEFHFHGTIPDKLKEQFTQALGTKGIFHGPYEPGGVDLSHYHFSLHLSVWPETYCQTLSEAWAARVVPIVTDIGALGERVENGKTGFKIDAKRPATLAHLLAAISRSPKEYLHVRGAITDSLFLDQTRHAELYREAFQKVLSDPQLMAIQHSEMSVPAEGVTMEVLHRRGRTPFWNQGKGRSVASIEVAPRNPKESDFGVLRRFFGNVRIVAGSLDSVDGEMATEEGEYEVRNEQEIVLGGWVQCPEGDNYSPVALLQTNDASYVTALNRSNRKDLVGAFGREDASLWGIAGAVRFLRPDELVEGVAMVRLGWLSSDGADVFASAKHIRAKGAFGG